METAEIVHTIESPTVGKRVTGWIDDTLGDGYSAICQTCCSPCVILTAIFVLFYGEFTWVQDQNNIMKFDKDMVDGVTMYDAANDGKPVAFFADGSQITAAEMEDTQFGVKIQNSMKARRVAYMVTGSTYKETSPDGKTQTEKCSQSWTSTIFRGGGSVNACAPNPPYTYNDKNFKGPCPTGTSCGKEFPASCPDGQTCHTVKAEQFDVPEYLIDYYTFRETPTLTTSNEWGTMWQAETVNRINDAKWFACPEGANTVKTYLSNNYRELLQGVQGAENVIHGTDSDPVCSNGYRGQQTPTNPTGQYTPTKAIGYDHSVSWEAWKIPAAGFTICSRQTSAKTFEELSSDSSYDLMLPGKKTKKDCIDAMTSAAHGQVILMRIFGFILLWCGFCMMFALVSFFADRVGSLIPCGLGEMFSDCVDCMITVVTCPPAAACWLFWWSLAWLIFNPMPYGLVFLAAVALMAGLAWWFKQNEKEPAKEDPIATEQPTNWNTQPTPTQAPPPPPADSNADANNDGIPDKYQDGLPPGWAAALDPSTGRIYWVNHNVSPAQSTWEDPRQPSAV